ncbi:HNH endonuclease [Bdellovibrio sp. HCB2-146]|uniref:HNH endonuclease n=1 Tax=Bdellovibrio sp. HCB2-146 TaxID=3394362 RepID=UPI0039BCDA67
MNKEEIKSLTDNEIISRVERMVRSERQIVECMIWHLQEIQDRKLFIQMGYTSLFECLVKHFKYSEPVAYTRISALKIINAVPEVAEALNSGEVSLTTLSMAQSFIRKQEKQTGEKVSKEQKIQFLESIRNKSTKEVNQVLAEINPVKELPLDKVNYLDARHAQLHSTIEKSLLDKIEHLKALISHENLTPTHNELLNMAFDAAIEKIEKKRGISSKLQKRTIQSLALLEGDAPDQKPATQSFSVKNSRYISRSVKTFVLKRSQHQCEYIHSDGKRCSSTFQLQFDHIKAFSKGGQSNLDNIQTLCRTHNAYKGSK